MGHYACQRSPSRRCAPSSSRRTKPAPDADHDRRWPGAADPKLRAGSFFPSLLERRRRIDRALFAVVMEAYLHGVSTRKVDDRSRPWAPTPA